MQRAFRAFAITGDGLLIVRCERGCGCKYQNTGYAGE